MNRTIAAEGPRRGEERDPPLRSAPASIAATASMAPRDSSTTGHHRPGKAVEPIRDVGLAHLPWPAHGDAPMHKFHAGTSGRLFKAGARNANVGRQRETIGTVRLATAARRRARRDPRIQARGGAPLLAVLDLGSNNCRLLIARPTSEGGFRVVDSFSRIVRLGEGVAQSGVLSQAAIARTIAALTVCARHIAASGARHVRAIATAAARGAANAPELVARVRQETGIALEVVSAEEEARLAAIGCAPLIGAAYEGALVFDIGGGSTEIIWMRRDEAPCILRSASVPVGVVTLAEDSAGTLFDAMRARMAARFQGVRDAMDGFDPGTHHLLGTSGTVTTLAAVSMGLNRYVRARVDASWHDCTEILKVVDRLRRLDPAGRAAIGPIGPDRADLVLPGCAIFSAIHALWPCAQLRVADRGLREGMLRELLKEALD